MLLGAPGVVSVPVLEHGPVAVLHLGQIDPERQPNSGGGGSGGSPGGAGRNGGSGYCVVFEYGW